MFYFFSKRTRTSGADVRIQTDMYFATVEVNVRKKKARSAFGRRAASSQTVRKSCDEFYLRCLRFISRCVCVVMLFSNENNG